MPILEQDIKIMKSASAQSLGGAISSAEVADTIHDLFDAVTGKEAARGDTEYRCVYIKNTHATLTLYEAVAYIFQNTPADGTNCEIGVGSSAVGGIEQAITNEKTEPVGVIFVEPDSEETGVLLGDLPPGQARAVWIKRVVHPGAGAFNSDCLWLGIYGDSRA